MFFLRTLSSICFICLGWVGGITVLNTMVGVHNFLASFIIYDTSVWKST